MKRFLPLILLVGACLLPLFLPSCANTTQAPSGGKKDSIPPLIIDMIAIGERTGDMPSALEHVAKRYESRLEKNILVFNLTSQLVMRWQLATVWTKASQMSPCFASPPNS